MHFLCVYQHIIIDRYGQLLYVYIIGGCNKLMRQPMEHNLARNVDNSSLGIEVRKNEWGMTIIKMGNNYYEYPVIFANAIPAAALGR